MLPTGGGKSGCSVRLASLRGPIIFSYLIRAIFYAVTAIILAMMLFLFVGVPAGNKIPVLFSHSVAGISCYRSIQHNPYDRDCLERLTGGFVSACTGHDENENYGCYLGIIQVTQ